MTDAEAGHTSCSDAWEAAYLAFESPTEARRKMRARLLRFGLQELERDAPVVEIFCGAGFGLEALTALGFSHVEGVDLSPELVARYTGPARCVVGDCRELSFEDDSKACILVHGGLHHLESLDDVERVLAEVRRVLAPDGRFCFVEPWRTPFLRLALFASKQRPLRRAWGKLDAFQTMVEHEQVTYDHWLEHPAEIEALLRRHFTPQRIQPRWGGLTFVGTPR